MTTDYINSEIWLLNQMELCINAVKFDEIRGAAIFDWLSRPFGRRLKAKMMQRRILQI